MHLSVGMGYTRTVHGLVNHFSSDMAHTFSTCSIMLEDFYKSGLVDDKVPSLKFEQVPFNHPLFIMYSSGTTGAPKCMVHSVGVSRFFSSISYQYKTNLSHLGKKWKISCKCKYDVWIQFQTVRQRDIAHNSNFSFKLHLLKA